MEFLRSFLRRHFAGKPVVRLRNVACFLKIDFMITLNEKPLLIESLFALGVGGGGGVLPYISHIGMCRPSGSPHPLPRSVFAPFWSEHGYTLMVWFSRKLRIYSSYQFRMNKKEREMCQFEVDFKKSFLLAF